tara:strand:- start:109816 stop:110121 length:306 start_codon:yes stop_codon:yes gene_type:complete
MQNKQIFSIFKDFLENKNLTLSDELNNLYLKTYKNLKIDLQDEALLETISKEDRLELLEKISAKINVDDINNQKIIDIFFHEITDSIDYIYNLIISKQLGG